MTYYIGLANLLSGLPNLLDRLTSLVRRSEPQGNARLHQQSSQSPPGRSLGPWSHRLRIERVRPEYLSDHLRRDIGLDM
jgi:hypothetical protein